MSPKKVLIIEDEPDIVEVLRYNLKREGYDVAWAGTGIEGLNLLRARAPDIVLLDLLLPGIDGLEVCRRMKSAAATRDLPIVMITAKGEESDIVLGLGLGADDYITKPFSPREVLARVEAVLRRNAAVSPTSQPERLEYDGLVIDLPAHRVTVHGEAQRFTATEFRLLSCLASQPERVFTRDQLIDRAIGDGAVVLDRNIDVHIRSVRQKLGPLRAVIETVRGVGYRFSPPG